VVLPVLVSSDASRAAAADVAGSPANNSDSRGRMHDAVLS